jgi:hypothetical protein
VAWASNSDLRAGNTSANSGYFGDLSPLVSIPCREKRY